MISAFLGTMLGWRMPVLARARALRADARVIAGIAQMQKNPADASSLSRYAGVLEKQADALESSLPQAKRDEFVGESGPIRYWLQFVTPTGVAFFSKDSRYFSWLKEARTEGIAHLKTMRAAHPEISRFEVVEIVSRKIATRSEDLGNALLA